MNEVQDAYSAGSIALLPGELEIVKAALARHIPGRRVWLFGSRATGRHLWRFSDLDLAIEGSLTWTERADLGEELDESDLPMKVDLVETGMVDASFLALIRPHFILLQDAAGPPAAG